MITRGVIALTAAGWIVAGARALPAQAPQRTSRIQPELRADAILARRRELQVGLGASIAVGTYLRLQLVGAAGMREPEAAESPRPTGRADLLARFVLDPYREHRWGPYGAAGLSQRLGAGARAYVVVALGAEAPPVAGWLPTIELGLGGGTRIGLIARRQIRGAR